MVVISEQDFISNLDGITLRDLAQNKPGASETLQQLGFSDGALAGVVVGWINHRLHKAGKHALAKDPTGKTTWAELLAMGQA